MAEPFSAPVEQTRGRRALLWCRCRRFWREETFLLGVFWFFLLRRNKKYILWIAVAGQSLGKTYCSLQHLLHAAWSINKSCNSVGDSQIPRAETQKPRFLSFLPNLIPTVRRGLTMLLPKGLPLLSENITMPPEFHKLNQCFYL